MEPENAGRPIDLRAAGDRIGELLDRLEASLNPRDYAQVQGAVCLVTDLYGGALARIMELVGDDSALVQRLVDDDLVASLLVVHDLHPHDLHERVRRAIDSVRPYLGSHGGDVEIVDIDGDLGTVTVKMLGSCDGCASSAVTLELAVRRAIEEHAPEITQLVVDGGSDGIADRAGADAGATSIPVALTRKPTHNPPMAPIYGLRGLVPGRVGLLEIEGNRLIVCRVGEQLYAYRNACPVCASDLETASVDGAALRCGECGSAYDLPRAGRSLDGNTTHLDPLPLVETGGEVRIAVAAVAAR